MKGLECDKSPESSVGAECRSCWQCGARDNSFLNTPPISQPEIRGDELWERHCTGHAARRVLGRFSDSLIIESSSRHPDGHEVPKARHSRQPISDLDIC